MDLPKDFFTVQSMLTLSGATGATFVVANTCQNAFNFNPRWLALLIAEVVVLSGVFMSGGATVIEYLVGAINGCLVYSSAAGATGILGGGPGAPAAIARGTVASVRAGEQSPSDRRRFLSSWF